MKIRSLIRLTPLLAVAAGFAWQGTVNSLLQRNVSTLQSAKSLTINFTQIQADSVPSKGSLNYSRPGKYRIEMPDRLTVSDGKTVWDLDKKANTYSEAPADLDRVVEDDVWAWSGFFVPEPYKGAQNVLAGPAHSIQGHSVQDCSFVLPVDRNLTLFLDSQGGAARGATIKHDEVNMTILASQITVGTSELPDSTFTFTPPAGAKKVDKGPNSYNSISKIMKASCVRCHSTADPRGGLDVSSYKTLMAGGSSGPCIVAGDPDNSLIVQLITGAKQPKMPQGKKSLATSQIDAIKAWIKNGAKEN